MYLPLGHNLGLCLARLFDILEHPIPGFSLCCLYLNFLLGWLVGLANDRGYWVETFILSEWYEGACRLIYLDLGGGSLSSLVFSLSIGIAAFTSAGNDEPKLCVLGTVQRIKD